MKNIFFIDKISHLLMLSLILTLFLTITTEYHILISGVLIIASIMLLKEQSIIIITVLFFTVFTSQTFESLRDLGLVIATILLFYIYFKKYGLKISSFPALPLEIMVFLVIFYISIIISVTFSDSISLSFFAGLRVTAFFIICYMLYALIDSDKVFVLFLKAILLISFIINLSIYYDFITEGFSFFLSNGILARFTGVSDNPNFVGMMTMFSTLLSIGFLQFPEKLEFRTKNHLYIIIFSNLFIFLILASRSSVIGSILGGIFILYYLNRNQLKIISLISISLIIVLFSISSIREFILVLIRLDDFSIRDYLWSTGIDIFNENVLTGIGPSLFGKEFYSYLPSSILAFYKIRVDIAHINPHPHNFFILMSAENGILGLVFSVLIFIIYFYFVFYIMTFTKNSNQLYYIISVALGGVGIGTLFRSFFEVSGVLNYGYISRDLPFWILMIVLMYIYRKVQTESKLV